MYWEISMLRFLVTVAVLVVPLPAMAQDAEVGEVYEITIQTEEDNQYVGQYGQVKMGDVVINVPNAKVDETYRVTITEIRVNQYSGDRQASCDFDQIGGDREGMCLGAP
jgi:predicted RNA-binding protein with TRAM domain